ncbi:DISP1 [Symbiodinium pilosum]|uniref:DISP1 protein n=1 Tax=Symbiodinium pilosum TaxID=2952 RepID=A0A812SFJ3_SYMPI|nr:DISP1 [Symbiodinium pilosum]
MQQCSNISFLSAEVQSWLLQVCEAARNDTLLLVRPEVLCWIEAWRSFVLRVGGSFPVTPRRMASEALQAFFHQEVSDLFLKDLATDAENFTGHPKFTVMRLLVNAPRNGGLQLLQPLKSRWMRFVEDLNRRAPTSAGFALMVSHAWTAMDMEESIMSKTLTSVILSVGIAVACVVIFSQNIMIGLLVLLTIVLEVCPLFGFLFGVMRYEFGAIEAVGVVTFVGMSVDYCLHLAHGYYVAERPCRSEKMQLALVNLGPSILGGALTTAAGTAFLLPCRIVLFVKLGTMLVANTMLSLLYTFLFLGPLLMILGPLGDVGSFSWLGRTCCGCCRRCRTPTCLRRRQPAVGDVPLTSKGQERKSRTTSISHVRRQTQVDMPLQPVEHRQKRETKVRFDRDMAMGDDGTSSFRESRQLGKGSTKRIDRKSSRLQRKSEAQSTGEVVGDVS